MAIAQKRREATRLRKGDPITVVDDKDRAYEAVVAWTSWTANSIYIKWSCGTHSGRVYMHDEHFTWIRGHGPYTRAALEAVRRLIGNEP